MTVALAAALLAHGALVVVHVVARARQVRRHVRVIGAAEARLVAASRDYRALRRRAEEAIEAVRALALGPARAADRRPD